MIRIRTNRSLLGACAALLLTAGSSFAAPATTAPATPERAAVEVPVYFVDAHWLADGAALDVAVQVDDTTIYREQIELLDPAAAEQGGTLAIELLAAAERSRVWLATVASRAPIHVGIHSGGLEIDRLAWEQLLDQGRSIDLDTLQPIRVVTETAPAARTAPVSALLQGTPTKAKDLIECIDDCEEDWIACGQTVPACDDAFLSCVSHCGILNPCTPGTEVDKQYQLIGFGAVSPTIYSCTDYFRAPGYFSLYQLYGTRYKVTTTTTVTTLQCGETITVEITYEYSNTCWTLVELNSCLTYPPENPLSYSPYLCS